MYKRQENNPEGVNSSKNITRDYQFNRDSLEVQRKYLRSVSENNLDNLPGLYTSNTPFGRLVRREQKRKEEKRKRKEEERKRKEEEERKKKPKIINAWCVCWKLNQV